MAATSVFHARRTIPAAQQSFDPLQASAAFLCAGREVLG